MRLNNRLKLNILLPMAVVAIASVSGCATKHSTPASQESDMKILSSSTNKGFCVSTPTKISVLVDTASRTFGTDNRFDGGDCKDEVLHFNTKRCFHSLEELDKYINSYTDYSFLINTKNIKGIEVSNMTVSKVIDYLNSRGSTKEIVYLDGDVKLENKYDFFIKDMNGLKEYVVSTTPFYFHKIHNDTTKSVYTLRYKATDNRLGDTDAIITNLREASKLTRQAKDIKRNKQRTINTKINNAINGVNNYDNNK
jgi:hypothetical protein